MDPKAVPAIDLALAPVVPVLVVQTAEWGIGLEPERVEPVLADPIAVLDTDRALVLDARESVDLIAESAIYQAPARVDRVLPVSIPPRGRTEPTTIRRRLSKGREQPCGMRRRDIRLTIPRGLRPTRTLGGPLSTSAIRSM